MCTSCAAVDQSRQVAGIAEAGLRVGKEFDWDRVCKRIANCLRLIAKGAITRGKARLLACGPLSLEAVLHLVKGDAAQEADAHQRSTITVD